MKIQNSFLISQLIIFLFLNSNIYSSLKFINNLNFEIGETFVFTVNVLGIHLGDQVLKLEKELFYNNYKIIVGYGELTSSEFVSKFYKLNDVEKTYFLPDNFIPLYYEKLFREGGWTNRTEYKFFPELKIIEYFDENKGKTVKFLVTNTIRNYFTLIYAMRFLDYDYYIRNNIPIEIDYITVEFIKKSIFNASYKKINYKNKKVNSIFLEEKGGVEMTAIILDDEIRTPYKLIIPALKVIGFKTINVYVELKEYKKLK